MRTTLTPVSTFARATFNKSSGYGGPVRQVVQPELEAGGEVLRNTLHRYAIPEQELRPLSKAHRDDLYQGALADPAR
jgi:hypothetical protein